MTITADKQIEFRGLRLDGQFEIQTIEGLADAPEVRTSDLVIVGRNGLRAGRQELGGRAVTIGVTIYAFAEAEFFEAVAALRTAFSPIDDVESPLTFRFPGIAGGDTARIMARARRMALPLTSTYWQMATEATVELYATDPRIYADTEQSFATTLPIVAGGGHTWPQSWPNSWGGQATSGSVTATNAGNYPAELSLRIDGPVTNPRVDNSTTGTSLAFDIDIVAGDFLLVDTDTGDVLLNGTADRRSTIVPGSTWPSLRPGVNELRFGAATTTEAVLYASWRSAWI